MDEERQESGSDISEGGIAGDGTDGDSGGGDVEATQDGFRRVIFGQIVDGLLPRRPGPDAILDDELNKAALSDPAALDPETPDDQPTLWRIVFLVALIAFALAVVFWKK